MTLEIFSPEAKLFSGEVTSVTLPGVDGSLQILNYHAPIVSILKKGDIIIAAASFSIGKEWTSKFKKIDDKTFSIEINSGTIEMNYNKVIVLID